MQCSEDCRDTDSLNWLATIVLILGFCNSSTSPWYAVIRHIVLWILRFNSQSLVCYNQTCTVVLGSCNSTVSVGMLYSNIYCTIIPNFLNKFKRARILQFISPSLAWCTQKYCPSILQFVIGSCNSKASSLYAVLKYMVLESFYSTGSSVVLKVKQIVLGILHSAAVLGILISFTTVIHNIRFPLPCPWYRAFQHFLGIPPFNTVPRPWYPAAFQYCIPNPWYPAFYQCTQSLVSCFSTL